MDNRWTFDNDELFDLVACGRKRGTCSLYGGDDQLSKISSHIPLIALHIRGIRKKGD